MDPALLYAIPGLIKAGYGIGQSQGWWGKGPKRKRSRFETGYVSELQRRSKEGVFTPGMQKEILSGTTSRLAEVAGRRREAIRGNIASQGLEDSIVSTYATRPIDRDVIANVAQVARELATRNQLSKVGAQDVLGQYGMQKSQQEYEDLLRAWSTGQQNIAGGLESAGRGLYYGAYYGGRNAKDKESVDVLYDFSDYSFKDAFARASQAGLKTFMWKGKEYNTKKG